MDNTASTTAKHTPGPWEIDTATRPDEICTIHGVPPTGDEAQGWVYVRGALGYWDATPEERLANARLIAAAPDLLAALRDANKLLSLMGVDLNKTTDYGTGRACDIVARIHSALAAGGAA